MGLEAGWNCHISLLSEEGGSSISTSPNTLNTVSRQHSDTSAKSNSHLDQCQINMDVCNVRVSWQDMARENKMAAKAATSSEGAANSVRKTSKMSVDSSEHEETRGGAELTKDVHVEFVNTNKQEDVIDEDEEDSNTGNNNSSTDDSPDGKQRTSLKETDAIDVKNMSLDVTKSSESESLLQDGRRKSSSGSEPDLGASLRGRHVSETQTFSDGTDADTLSHYTESDHDTTGGFDISNRVRPRKFKKRNLPWQPSCHHMWRWVIVLPDMFLIRVLPFSYGLNHARIVRLNMRQW